MSSSGNNTSNTPPPSNSIPPAPVPSSNNNPPPASTPPPPSPTTPTNPPATPAPAPPAPDRTQAPTTPSPSPAPAPPPPAATTPPVQQTRPPTVITTIITTFTTSLSTSGTATFPVTVPVTRATVLPADPNVDSGASSDGQSSILTPAFWGIMAAAIGAVALCAGAICFLRGRVRNRKNERVYRASSNATFNNTGGTFQPGLNTARPMNSMPFNKPAAAPAGYAGNVVTLVELADGTTKDASTLSNSPPPMQQPQPVYASQPAYGIPPPMAGYNMQPQDPYGYSGASQPAPPMGNVYAGNGYDPGYDAGYGMQSGPPAAAQHIDEDEGVIHFAPTVNRDTSNEYLDLPAPPPGMAYRTNDATMQPELFYLSEPDHDGGRISPNAPGVTRRLALPGNH